MSDKVKERIKSDAHKYVKKFMPYTTTTEDLLCGYVDGATAEHPKAWNEAVDECAATYSNLWINRVVNGLKPTPDEMLKAFEKLKHKQP